MLSSGYIYGHKIMIINVHRFKNKSDTIHSIIIKKFSNIEFSKKNGKLMNNFVDIYERIFQ